MENAFSLAGQHILITGGGSGLGFGMAQCLVTAGAKVTIVGRREAELTKAAAQLGPAAAPLSHDITNLEKAPELILRAEKTFGALTGLVNNAGIHLKRGAQFTTAAEFQSVLTTHVCAAHSLVAAVLPGMIERKNGAILFTASMAALIGIPLVVAYSAAKSAYIGMVRSLASEVSAHGVRVNAIAPGWIDTPMLRQALHRDTKRTNKILARTPMARFGEPEDIGYAAVYRLSPVARFVTGIVLPVDGGASIGF